MSTTPSTTPSTPAPPAGSASSKERKPLLAAAGAADAAVRTLRDLPARVSGAVNDETLRTQVRQRFSELPADVKAFRESFPDFLLQAQSKANDLPLRLREFAAHAGRQASRTYDELAGRGEDVVERLRGEYGPTVSQAVTTMRQRMAEAAEGVAQFTDRAANKAAEKTSSKPSGKAADEPADTAADTPAADLGDAAGEPRTER